MHTHDPYKNGKCGNVIVIKQKFFCFVQMFILKMVWWCGFSSPQTAFQTATIVVAIASEKKLVTKFSEPVAIFIGNYLVLSAMGWVLKSHVCSIITKLNNYGLDLVVCKDLLAIII